MALASNGILLRFSGLYGPGRLLSRVESLRAGTPLTGNPDAWLNLIYIDDAVTAVRACANHGQAGEIYLGTDNQPIRRRDYYSQLEIGRAHV